jgi:hypothetical protein
VTAAIFFLIVTALSPDLSATARRWKGKVAVDVVQASCGMENAMYFPSLQLVVMCRELDYSPAMARFVLNHEMGHAWMYQHDVPNSERGADELALLMSTKAEAIAAADFFDKLGEDDDGDDGEHQSHTDRAATFRCVAYGLHMPTQTTAICRMYAESLREQWARLGFEP